MTATASGGARQAAVIDIGSNSVRMVLYRLEGRAVWTVFNEKVLAGLGRDLAATGRLSVEGVQTALPALRRFGALIRSVGPELVLTAATAAVREAKDGPDFCAMVEREAGLSIRVLSGEEEAKYAGLGVLAGDPGAEGVAADLGGASLELIRIGAEGIGRGVTLPLGPFALGGGDRFDLDRMRAAVSTRLRPVAKAYSGETLHAVGGAWRALAQMHMVMADYPLKIVHQYAITASEARDLSRLVARQSRTSLERSPGVSKKRAETLPYAALVLEGLIDRLGLSTVSFSAWGVREGLLFDAMGNGHVDPLLAGCEALGRSQGVDPGFASALGAWLIPLAAALPPAFGAPRDTVLTRAACHLADLGARTHPDHRIELVFEQILRAPIPGQTHPERVFLATVLNARYGGSASTPEPDLVDRLLPEEMRARARALGLAIRLASDLSGRSACVLDRVSVSLTPDVLRLHSVDESADLLMGEQTRRRAKALAEAMGRSLQIDA